jgi:two-component system response regulator AtoC
LTRAVVVSTGEVIRPDHLAIGPASPDAAPGAAGLSTLAELEREHVARVMTATDGHKARTVELLGISRPRLNRLPQKYELE